ncbi:MAG: hypothetical protein MRY81_03015 [Donghicola eburneus]|nr:hypothetical protein [Donghicola eburneus]MCI5038632.1 hypothetical protein [Donghicola eburneus]
MALTQRFQKLVDVFNCQEFLQDGLLDQSVELLHWDAPAFASSSSNTICTGVIPIAAALACGGRHIAPTAWASSQTGQKNITSYDARRRLGWSLLLEHFLKAIILVFGNQRSYGELDCVAAS